MTMNLINATASPANTSRTLVYSCPSTSKSATIVGGKITNTDDMNQVVHLITLELEVSTGLFRKLGHKLAIPYGVSPTIPTTNIMPGQKIHLTIDQANTIDLVLDLAERI